MSNAMMTRLAAQAELTPGPGEGFNVVGVDTFEEPGDDLFFVSNHDTRAEAEAAADRFRRSHDDGPVFVYGSSEPVQKSLPSHFISTRPIDLEW